MRSIRNRGGLTRGRGMAESTCDLWVGNMHKFGEVYHTMESVTRQWHQSSEHYVEMKQHVVKETILMSSFSLN